MANLVQPLQPYANFVDDKGILTRDGYDFLYNIYLRIGGSLDSLNAATLADKTWDSPNPIGSGTPSTGAFTSLSASSLNVSSSATISDLTSPTIHGTTITATDTTTTNMTASDLDVNGPVDVTGGNVTVATAGKGLSIKGGTNAKIGTAVLVAGTIVVSTTAVTANSIIFLTSQVDGGTPGFLRVSAKTAGTSFTITSSSATDTSTVGWMIVEKG